MVGMGWIEWTLSGCVGIILLIVVIIVYKLKKKRLLEEQERVNHVLNMNIPSLKIKYVREERL